MSWWWETDESGITKKQCVERNANFYFIYDDSHNCFPHFWLVHKRFWHEHHQSYGERIRILEGNAIFPPDHFIEVGASLYKYEPYMALSGVDRTIPAGKRAFVSGMVKDKKAKKNHQALRLEGESDLIKWGFTQPQKIAERELVHTFVLEDNGQRRVNWICDSDDVLVKLRNLRNSLVVHDEIHRGKFKTMEQYLDWVRANMFDCATGGSLPTLWIMSKVRADRLPPYPPDPAKSYQPFFK